MHVNEMLRNEAAPYYAAARAWFLDLDNESMGYDDRDDYVDLIEGLTPGELHAAIARKFDGGWKAFMLVTEIEK